MRMSQIVQSCEAKPIGNGDSASLHHPHYDFNDAAAPYGASLWARLIETGLPRSA